MDNKKRGRKPKGGKVLESTLPETTMSLVENIILHLKCNNKDIS